MMKPAFLTVLKTSVFTGLVAMGVNLALWLAAGLATPLTIPFAPVILNSMLGLLVGGLIYFGLSRFLGARTNRVFTIVSVLFLIAYASAPIAAMSQEPAPGMGLFNTATMVVTELMHLASGGLAMWNFRKLMPGSTG